MLLGSEIGDEGSGHDGNRARLQFIFELTLDQIDGLRIGSHKCSPRNKSLVNSRLFELKISLILG